MYSKRILKLVKSKKGIKLTGDVKNNKILIIDFFNIYCNVIKFNKYKTFSTETCLICIDFILECFRNYTIIIVSKDIFELDNSIIREYTRLNSNLIYIIVHDEYDVKSKNRERDDYICIIYQALLKNDNKVSTIVTNDIFRNLDIMLSSIKPISIKRFKGKEELDIFLDSDTLKYYNSLLSFKDIGRSGFKFI